jgi:hypothetical protein
MQSLNGFETSLVRITFGKKGSQKHLHKIFFVQTSKKRIFKASISEEVKMSKHNSA